MAGIFMPNGALTRYRGRVGSLSRSISSAFKIASVNPVLWWGAESHRAALAGGAATLFRDSAGTSPVTAVEQLTGLALDSSGGFARGPQLITNGSNFTTTTGWFPSNVVLSVSAGNLVITRGATAGPVSASYQFTGAVVGVWYAMEIIVATNDGGANIILQAYGNSSIGQTSVSSATGRRSVYFRADRTNPSLIVRVENGSSGNSVSLSLASVQSITGQHALQVTSPARPLLTARSNALDISEDYPSWGAPGNITRSADGTNPYGRPAYRLTVNATGSAIMSRTVGAVTGAFVEVSFWVRKGSFASASANEWGVYDNTAGADRAFIRVNFDTLVTTVSRGSALSHGVMAQAPGGWVRIFIRFAHTPGNSLAIYLGAIGGGAYMAGDYWSCGGASVTPLSTATAPSPAYQWSTSSTVYDASVAPMLLSFDGADDTMTTGTLASALPASADVYMVVRRAVGDASTVLLYSTAGGQAIGTLESGSASASFSGIGSPVTRVNGSVLASGGVATRGQLYTAMPEGVACIYELNGADLSTLTALSVGAYGAPYNFSGLMGDVLICPAQSDTVRSKIRKLLAATYQISGVV